MKVHRKAPKRKAKPLDRALSAALIRRVTEHWVPKHQHEAFKKNATETLRAEVERELKNKQDSTRLHLQHAKQAVESFEEWSGVKLTREPGAYDDATEIRFTYDNNLKDIGEAVKLVAAARAKCRWWRSEQTAADVLKQELQNIERTLHFQEQAVEKRREVADQLRREIARLEVECQSGLVSTPDGTSPAASDGDDHQGSGNDRGNAGTPEQDAGVQLRD